LREKHSLSGGRYGLQGILERCLATGNETALDWAIETFEDLTEMKRTDKKLVESETLSHVIRGISGCHAHN
jgi:hypothetical protein